MSLLFMWVYRMIWMTYGMGAIMMTPSTPPTMITTGITMGGDEEYLDVAYNISDENIYFTGYNDAIYSSYPDGTVPLLDRWIECVRTYRRRLRQW